jgi:hypothetical protein
MLEAHMGKKKIKLLDQTKASITVGTTATTICNKPDAAATESAKANTARVLLLKLLLPQFWDAMSATGTDAQSCIHVGRTSARYADTAVKGWSQTRNKAAAARVTTFAHAATVHVSSLVFPELYAAMIAPAAWATPCNACVAIASIP